MIFNYEYGSVDVDVEEIERLFIKLICEDYVLDFKDTYCIVYDLDVIDVMKKMPKYKSVWQDAVSEIKLKYYDQTKDGLNC